MPVHEVYSWLLLIAAIWLVLRYYWLRVAATGLALLAWGLFAVFLPIWVVTKYLTENNPMAAILAVAVCSVQAGLWFAGAAFALKFYRNEQRWSTFWKPWNER